IETGEGSPVECELDPKQNTTLGHHRNNTIHLEDALVSPQHAAVFCEGDQWYIRDCNTPIGTWVNGKRITQVTSLKDGQTISIGDARLRFLLAGEEGEVAAGLENQDMLMDGPDMDLAGSPTGELVALNEFMKAAALEKDPRALVQLALRAIHGQTRATETGFL